MDSDTNGFSKMIFWSQFWPLLKQASFLEAAGAVSKISLSLKSNHNWQIKLAQIDETHSSLWLGGNAINEINYSQTR